MLAPSPAMLDARNRHDSISLPTIRLALVLSLLLHAAVLLQWGPRLRLSALDDALAPDRSSGPLVVQITPEPPPATPQEPARIPPPSRAAEPQAPSPPAVSAPPARRETPSKPAARAPASPPRIARDSPSPRAPPAPSPTPSITPEPAPRSATLGGDFMADMQARRQAREQRQQIAAADVLSDAVRMDEEERRREIVANNLGLGRAPTFGDARSSGGVFRIERLGYHDAEFTFFGWNRDIERKSRQRIEVRRGDHPTIELAVVRRMIVIIRERESGDFQFLSRRLGREVTLSARARDNAGLEEFLLREFFAEGMPR